jgi:hypothetical protein
MPKWQKETWYYGQFYCPEFGDDHYMYKNWYKENYSYIRLGLNKCDQAERELVGETCASDEEIFNYLQITYVSLIGI